MLTLGLIMAVGVLILGLRYIDHLDKVGRKAEREIEQKLSGDSTAKFKIANHCREQKYIQIK